MQKAKRVREALLTLDGVVDVFVGREIALQLAPDAKPEPARLTEQIRQKLTPEKVEVKELSVRRTAVW